MVNNWKDNLFILPTRSLLEAQPRAKGLPQNSNTDNVEKLVIAEKPIKLLRLVDPDENSER